MKNARVDRKICDEDTLKKDDAKKDVSLKCDDKFTKAIDLETHMTKNGLVKKHSC